MSGCERVVRACQCVNERERCMSGCERVVRAWRTGNKTVRAQVTQVCMRIISIYMHIYFCMHVAGGERPHIVKKYICITPRERYTQNARDPVFYILNFFRLQNDSIYYQIVPNTTTFYIYQSINLSSIYLYIDLSLYIQTAVLLTLGRLNC